MLVLYYVNSYLFKKLYPITNAKDSLVDLMERVVISFTLLVHY